MDTILVVTAVDPGTAGTVWYFDVAHDCGVLPMVHPATGAPLRFLEWFELCLDARASDEEPCGSEVSLEVLLNHAGTGEVDVVLVMGNFFGSGLCLGIDRFKQLVNQGDNGTYVIDG